MAMQRWEQGSEFHRPPTPDYAGQAGLASDDAGASAWRQDAIFWMSGRAALRAILTQHRDPKRLWVPSNFCQKVLGDLMDLGVALKLYPDTPLEPMAGPDLTGIEGSDIVLVSNTFGLRVQSWSPPEGAVVIEDHTHDPLSPWALSSKADWCFASLRKWFPVPAGGVAWSPKRRTLAIGACSEAEESAATEKLTSMVLKGLYLNGNAVDKDDYRRLSLGSEDGLGAARGAAPSWLVALLRSFPTDRWREARAANLLVLEQALSPVSGVTLLRPSDDAAAFSAVLVLESAAERDSLRHALIRDQIYPAILWELDDPAVTDISERDLELSRCILSVHCDMRYDSDDMKRVAQTITDLAMGRAA